MKAAVVTYADSGVAAWDRISRPNKERYCRERGYCLLAGDLPIRRDLGSAWQKIPTLRTALDAFDLVFWSDADALVMNFDVRLEELIGDFDLLIASDPNGLNSGQILVRSCPETLAFFDRLLAAPKRNLSWEQSSLSALLNDAYADNDRFRVTAQRVMNSSPPHPYYQDRREKPCLGRYVQGDFIVHYPGLNGTPEVIEHFRETAEMAGHHGRNHPRPDCDVRPITAATSAARVAKIVDAIPETPAHQWSGRGIVIAAGGPRLFANAWVCIRLLREHACSLPIELWHLGRAELDETMVDLVARYNVECVDALEVRKDRPARIIRGWPLKPYATLHSRFEEVLFLDADNCLLRDPEYLFDSDDYLEFGSLFWPDENRFPRDHPAWDLIGVPYRNEPEFETGQFLIDKSRTWRALALTVWLNGNADFYYNIVHGDKDTFRLAFHRLGIPFGMIGFPVMELKPPGHRGLGTRLQHDPAGDAVFQHRSFPKWSLHGANPRVAGFRFERRCLQLLDELGERWSGQVTSPAESSAPERDWAAAFGFPVTICVLAYGPHADLADRFLRQLYENTDPSQFELRVGLNEVEPRTRELFDRASDEHGNVEVYAEEKNIFKAPLMRRMFHEIPIRSNWVIWFDDDSFPTRPDWLPKLVKQISRNPEVYQWGTRGRIEYPHDAPIIQFINEAEWNTRVPLSNRSDALQRKTHLVEFVCGGFWAMRCEAIRLLNWPDPEIVQFCDDILLGAALRQHNLPLGAYDYGVTIGDAPRRNSAALEVSGFMSR